MENIERFKRDAGVAIILLGGTKELATAFSEWDENNPDTRRIDACMTQLIDDIKDRLGNVPVRIVKSVHKAEVF